MTDKFDKILKIYDTTTKLKTLMRTGWQRWKLEGVRAESVAEHVFGTCMLAVAIYSELNLDIDIDKVILMLVLHETEEALIGDITFVDPEYATKSEEGRKAVLNIFGDSKNASHFLDLINEFEERKTSEAVFAFRCDKFEADLQAFKYDKNFNLSKVEDLLNNHPQIIEYRKNGMTKVSQFFLESDMQNFDDEFTPLALELKKRINK